jgi:uncharacterized SAM-binding protein YcdF (DUF218 family)
VNDFFVWLGLDGWRNVLATLLMPPVPMLAMVLAGAGLMARRRALAWLLVLAGAAGIWLSCTSIASGALRHWMLPAVPALTSAQVDALKHAPRTAIVVLGGGRKLLAVEYGSPDLRPLSLDRLRYGLWLGRTTSLPVMFSGGVGHAAASGPSEAEIAARVAERDFGRPLQWQEAGSRDTRENALRSVALLGAQGIERIVVVTHGYHMPRALDNFARAAAQARQPLDIVAAPMGLEPRSTTDLGDYLPSREGYTEVRLTLHEWIGRLVGA